MAILCQTLSAKPKPSGAFISLMVGPNTDHILMVKCIHTGHWMLPGGTVDVHLGETADKAAIREFKEETSFPLPQSAKSISKYVANSKWGDNTFFVWKWSGSLSDIQSRFRPTDETTAMKLVPFQDLFNGKFTEPVRDFNLNRLRDMKKAGYFDFVPHTPSTSNSNRVVDNSKSNVKVPVLIAIAIVAGVAVLCVVGIVICFLFIQRGRRMSRRIAAIQEIQV